VVPNISFVIAHMVPLVALLKFVSADLVLDSMQAKTSATMAFVKVVVALPVQNHNQSLNVPQWLPLHQPDRQIKQVASTNTNVVVHGPQKENVNAIQAIWMLGVRRLAVCVRPITTSLWNAPTDILNAPNGDALGNAEKIPTGWRKIAENPAINARNHAPKYAAEEHNRLDRLHQKWKNVILPVASMRMSAVSSGDCKDSAQGMPRGWRVIVESAVAHVSLRTISMEPATTITVTVVLGHSAVNAARIRGCWRIAVSVVSHAWATSSCAKCAVVPSVAADVAADLDATMSWTGKADDGIGM
jgi:hypothetical protein